MKVNWWTKILANVSWEVSFCVQRSQTAGLRDETGEVTWSSQQAVPLPNILSVMSYHSNRATWQHFPGNMEWQQIGICRGEGKSEGKIVLKSLPMNWQENSRHLYFLIRVLFFLLYFITLFLRTRLFASYLSDFIIIFYFFLLFFCLCR